MDKQRAYEILHLDAGASKQEAKKAFRKRAKSCHPDRFSSRPQAAVQAETRMKEINAAFEFLLPLLPDRFEKEKQGAGQGFESSQTPEKRAGIFSDLKKRFFSRAKAPASVKTGKNRPGFKSRRSKSGSARPVSSKVRFESFLNQVQDRGGKGSTNSEELPKVRGRSGTKPGSYQAYRRYVRLKKQVQSRRQRADEGIGRVEKISPVHRVDPVTRD